MFKKLKDKIADLAYAAVNYAEDYASTASGKDKKQKAIAFLVDKLEITMPLKPLVVFLFTSFIDKSIEKAVAYMNQVKNED